jgi:hypothetical protein
MRAGSEAQSQHARLRVAKRGHRLTPVFKVGISTAAHPRHLGTVGAETRAELAGNDTGVQNFERSGSSGHGEILGDYTGEWNGG